MKSIKQISGSSLKIASRFYPLGIAPWKQVKNMSQLVIKAQDVVVANIATQSNVKTLDNGGRMVWMSYNGRPLLIQLPAMKAPFGVSEWSDEKTGAKKYSLDLSFDGVANNQALADTFNMLKELDAKILNDGMENSVSWLKKRYTAIEIVEALFYPSIKMPKDDKYSPTMKLSLAHNQGEFKCLVFDSCRNPLNILETNTKGAEVTAIVKLAGVWLAGGKFGISWKVEQLRIAPRATLTNYAFIDDDTTTTTNRKGVQSGGVYENDGYDEEGYEQEYDAHTNGSD